MDRSGSTQGPDVVILLGSKSDVEHRAAIARGLDRFGVTHETRIASAHRVTRYLLDLVDSYERDGRPQVYITVAGPLQRALGRRRCQLAPPCHRLPALWRAICRHGSPLDGAYAGRRGADARAGSRGRGAWRRSKILAIGDPALAERIAAWHGGCASRPWPTIATLRAGDGVGVRLRDGSPPRLCLPSGP